MLSACLWTDSKKVQYGWLLAEKAQHLHSHQVGIFALLLLIGRKNGNSSLFLKKGHEVNSGKFLKSVCETLKVDGTHMGGVDWGRTLIREFLNSSWWFLNLHYQCLWQHSLFHQEMIRRCHRRLKSRALHQDPQKPGSCTGDTDWRIIYGLSSL